MRALLLALSVLAFTGAAEAKPCDRVCLAAALDAYLGGLIAHDSAAARLAPEARLTENGAVIDAAQGLWKDVTGVGALDRRYFDPASGQAAFYGLLSESDLPVIAIIRIKVKDGAVIESESIVSRKGERLYNPEGALKNPPPDVKLAPKANRASRAAMIAAANAFYDGMQNHSNAGLPVTQHCARYESGSGDPSHKCNAGLERLVQISAVGYRRFTVIDEAAGAAISTAIFLRPPGAKMPDGNPWKRNMFMNLMTFEKNRISGIWGAMHYMEPQDAQTTGWPK